MSKLTMAQKAERCVRLLLGMRHPEVGEALKPYGFTRATLDDGWARMRALTAPRAAAPVKPPPAAPILPAIQAFERTWFPIARTALHYRYPGVSKQLFAGLTQGRGHDACISVLAFLDRLERMAEGMKPFGIDGPAARDTLRDRGLTDERIADVEAVFDRLTTPNTQPPPGIATAAADERQAVDAMWAWYLEWSATARVAIKNKTLLRALGLSSQRSRRAEEPRGLDCERKSSPQAPRVDFEEPRDD